MTHVQAVTKSAPDRKALVTETMQRVFPARTGTVARGSLTRLYDERFGQYERAQDFTSKTEVWPTSSWSWGFKLSENTQNERVDVIAEALFAGGYYHAKGPLFLPDDRVGDRAYVIDAGTAIALSSPRNTFEGVLVLDLEGNEQNLLVKTRLVLSRGLGLVNVEPAAWGGVVVTTSEDTVLEEAIARHGYPNILSEVAKFPSVHEATTFLCNMFGVPEANFDR